MFDYRRSHHCNSLTKKDVGSEVTLSGWVHRRRDHGGLIFIDLRDRYGITQLLFDPKISKTNHDKASRLRSEWVISAKGKVIPRAQGMTNTKLPTGEIEIEVNDFDILSEAKTPPFSICDEIIDVHEEHRLKHRYLDLRRGSVAKNLELRHKLMMSIRKYLDSHNFLEITTPILGKSSIEGAREFLVPSRIHPGNFYALPQSPQLYKQLLMMSGLDRYFQIAPCFRDEDLRSDRQPEFTQIDIEMSFGVPDDFLKLIEGLVCTMFKECIQEKLNPPFPTMTYKDCLEYYGSDRPDMRFEMKLTRIDDIAKESTFSIFKNQLEQGGCVKGLCVKKGADISRKEIERYTEFVKPFGLLGLGWMKYQDGALSSSIVKFFTTSQQQELIKRFEVEEGDLLLFGAEQEAKVNQSLDHLRRLLAKERGLIDENALKFLWVREFPLFEKDSVTGEIYSVTHPFTTPDPRDAHLLDSEPLRVRSLAYDLICNGYELGGGSQRIHAKPLQEQIYKILGLTQDQIDNMFGYFSDALDYGTPPHLGLAFGLDRIAMILCRTDNIRDVIAFPKTQKGTDLMTSSPSRVDKKQTDELALRIISER